MLWKTKGGKSCMNLRASSTSWLFGSKKPVGIQSALCGRAQLGQHQPGHRQWPGLTTSLEQGISLCVALNTKILAWPSGQQMATDNSTSLHPGEIPFATYWRAWDSLLLRDETGPTLCPFSFPPTLIPSQQQAQKSGRHSFAQSRGGSFN